MPMKFPKPDPPPAMTSWPRGIHAACGGTMGYPRGGGGGGGGGGRQGAAAGGGGTGYPPRRSATRKATVHHHPSMTVH